MCALRLRGLVFITTSFWKAIHVLGRLTLSSAAVIHDALAPHAVTAQKLKSKETIRFRISIVYWYYATNVLKKAQWQKEKPLFLLWHREKSV